MSKAKTIILKVNQSTFLDWFYSDLSSSEARDIANDVISSLQKTGKFEETAENKFRDCGYFPFRIIKFPSEELEEEFANEFEDEELLDTEGEINGRPFKLVLIKTK